MEANRIPEQMRRWFYRCAGPGMPGPYRWALAACLSVACLLASEHHGWVKSGGAPVPGATVTVTQGDKSFVTSTDDSGAYSFPNLPDGVWTLRISMLGFSPVEREIGVAPEAPSPSWDLRVLTLDALRKQLAPPAPAASTPSAPAAAAASTTPAAPTQAAATKPAAGSAAAGGGRSNGSGGRPSLRQSMQQGGFQRLDVNQSGEAELDNGSGGSAAEMGTGDVTQSSDAYVVNGSVNSGLNMPQQNDWGFGGPGGPGGMGGPGGPGGMGMIGMGGPGGPGMGGGAPAAAGGGAGGPGGGFGGRGGGGFGGRGGGFGGNYAGGRGGRGGRGGNQASFGNGRRNPRSHYNANIALILNNSALDARPFSLTGQDTPKAAFAQFRSTGMLGGPLKIPHVLSGQHTFFTINYQLTRGRNATTTTAQVPTMDERAGNFSQALSNNAPVTIYDPLSGAPFAGNVIPTIRLDSAALDLLKFYPQPNFAGDSQYNYQAPIVSISNQTNINSRISETINAKNQVSGSFSWQGSNSSTPNLFDFIDTTKMTGINTGVQWNYHITMRLISNLRYNFSRSATNATPFFANSANVSAEAGIVGNDQAAQFWGPPSLSFSSGIYGLSDGNYQLNHNNTSQAGESLIWVRGAHNVTFGGDFRRLDFNQIAQQNARGSFTFTGAMTGLAGSNGQAASGTGFDFADFLLGLPDASSIAYSSSGADKYFRASWVDTYVTDDWHIRSNFTLNFGLRWDFQAPVTELYNRLVSLEVGPDWTTTTPVCGTDTLATGTVSCTLASQAGLPDSLVRPNYHEFQPRIGLAWKPIPKHSTVVRAGYGLYYNTSVFQPLANQMSQQAPLSDSVRQSYTVSQAQLISASDPQPLSLENALTLPAISTTPQTFALDPNFRIGYIHYWQASVQQNLSGSFVATFTYSGDKGTHQVQEFLPWTFPAGDPVSPYPYGYVYETSNGNSNYNAASAQLQHRFHSGFLANATYVFSKAIDDAQTLGGRGAAGSAYAQNWLDLDAERSLSSFNRTHTLNLIFQYSTGMGTRGGTLINGWKGVLLKDWTLGPSLTLGSGLPETPIVIGRLASGTGIAGTTRAEYLGGPLEAALPGYGFDTAVFEAPPDGQWGDAGRNSITGPMQFGLNFSAARVFRFGERRSMDIRFDGTNVLNHVTWASWNTTLGNSQFGLPTGANGMRTIQATVRFRF
ncbi:MAG: TonB-dependent receptor [Bryobacteraceae bacterium]